MRTVGGVGEDRRRGMGESGFAEAVFFFAARFSVESVSCFLLVVLCRVCACVRLDRTCRVCLLLACAGESAGPGCMVNGWLITSGCWFSLCANLSGLSCPVCCHFTVVGLVKLPRSEAVPS